MLGKRLDQRGLWEADRLYLDHVGKDTFYGLLAALRGQLFSDDDFAEIYCPDNGRDSVPPSLLATALLLQTYDKVSDAAAKARADFDIRWKVALGIEIEDRPFAKSTLQLFRAQLILHDKVREAFDGSLRLARRSGYLKKRGMRVALDTTCILGRGAVQDTYNLLADGIVKLLRALAAVAKIDVREWAEGQGYEKYLGSSIKGEAVIDWSDRKARAALLAEIVADADRLLGLARQAWVELPEDSAQRQSIVAGAELLGQLLLQDIERQSGDGDGDADAADADDGVSLRDGVSKDRMLSVHDPEMRHGHQSSRRRFDGHKAAIVVDTDSQLITAVDVLPGNAPDNLGALELVEQSEASTGSVVEEAMGDAAYGDGGTRQTFADAGRRLVAKVPGRPDRKHFPKNDFHLDLAAGSCTCPAGQVTGAIVPAGKRTDGAGRVYRLQAPVRRGGMWGMSTAAPVHRGQRQAGTAGADPSAGNPAAGGQGFAAERCLRRVSSAPSGGRASAGAAGPAGHPPVPLLRACQDAIPAVPGGHGVQPDPGVGQHRAFGQCRWRRSRPPCRPQYCPKCRPRCCRQCGGQFQRCPARTTIVPDFVRLGFTAATPLPNQGFPARFLAALRFGAAAAR